MARTIALVGLVCLATADPAAAQLFALAPTKTVLSGGCVTNDDIAYDPIHDVYLVVADLSTHAFACFYEKRETSLRGVFVDRHGNPIGAPFVIDGASVQGGVRAAFSPDISDGAGGFGAFLVVSGGHDANGRGAVDAYVVAYPGRVVGSRTTISPVAPDQVALAYSPTAKRFLVAWAYGRCGLPPCSPYGSEFVMVGLDGRPLGPPMTLGTPLEPPVCFPGPDFWENTVDVVWNAYSGQFGVLYVQRTGMSNAHVLLARFTTEGRVSGQTALGIQNVCEGRAKAAAVNTTTASYLAVWSANFVNVSSEISPAGQLITTTVLPSSDVLNPFQLIGISFSATSGTFLLTGWSGPPSRFDTLHALELDGHGAPIPASLVAVRSIGTWHAPRAASREGSGEWVVALAGFGGGGFEAPPSDTESGVATLAFGTPTIAPVGCIGPDPFAFLGGGTCFNGGWLPPGITPPQPGGCTSPDPFTALGGGTCFNGGWLPPGIPPPGSPQPSPPAPPATCLTPDPFTAMGGGVCVDGGWVPRNHPRALSGGG